MGLFSFLSNKLPIDTQRIEQAIADLEQKPLPNCVWWWNEKPKSAKPTTPLCCEQVSFSMN